LADKIQQFRKELTTRIDQADADLKRQREIDGRALLLVNQQLERNPGSPVNETEMREAILEASPAIAVQIFEAARRARRNNRTDQYLMQRVATVLRAIISRKDQKSHRPLAQLAYILEKVVPPQVKESLELINRAIEIRNQRNDDGYPRYELHRISCLIDLDKNFARHQKSDPEMKQRIIDDLLRGLALEQAKDMLREAVAKSSESTAVEQQGVPGDKYSKLALWLRINDVSLKDIGLELSPNASAQVD
jgi:hypothetical protein